MYPAPGVLTEAGRQVRGTGIVVAARCGRSEPAEPTGRTGAGARRRACRSGVEGSSLPGQACRRAVLARGPLRALLPLRSLPGGRDLLLALRALALSPEGQVTAPLGGA